MLIFDYSLTEEIQMGNKHTHQVSQNTNICIADDHIGIISFQKKEFLMSRIIFTKIFKEQEQKQTA